MSTLKFLVDRRGRQSVGFIWNRLEKLYPRKTTNYTWEYNTYFLLFAWTFW